MTFLIDTNVLSELIKSRPNPSVIQWLSSTDEDLLYVSVVALCEIQQGIEQLIPSRRRDRLQEWLSLDLMSRLKGRILPIDEEVALEWAIVSRACESVGRPIQIMDAFIAATARVHNFCLVTRDVGDFETSVQNILDPWGSKSSL